MSLARWLRKSGVAVILLGFAFSFAKGGFGIAYAAPQQATGTVEVAFTPWDDAEGLIVRTLLSAQSTVRVQAYVFTSRNIAVALMAAKDRGVDVQMMADKESVKAESSLVPLIAQSGVPVRLETRYAIAHNKIMVVDGETAHPAVITGSFNFTFAAQARNAENLLVIRDNLPLAKHYSDNWQRHWEEAAPYNPATGEVTIPSTRGGKAKPAPSTTQAIACALLSVRERRIMGIHCPRKH